MSERLTREQAAIVGAYTGYLAGPFSDMHKLAEEVLGRPVWTHEFGGGVNEELRAAVKDRFLGICAAGTADEGNQP